MSLAFAGLFLSQTISSNSALAKDATAKLIDKAKDAVEAPAPSLGRTRKHAFGIGLGQTFVLGDFEDHGEDKITVDLFYLYRASYSFDFLVNGHISEHSDQSEYSKLAGLTMSIRSKVYDYDSFTPYFLGGLGFYRPKVRRVISPGNTIDSKGKFTFGFNVGGGAELRLNEIYSIGVLAQYHKPFKVDQTGQADVSGSYFKLLITLLYGF